MATGRAKHDAYKAALSMLGKDLARRAKSKCELSGAAGSLVTVDLNSAAQDPDLHSVVLVCAGVAEQIAGRQLDQALYYLNDAVWSPEPAVRLAACMVLEQIDEPWARDALDNAKLMDSSETE
ncbi:MAG: protein PhnA [Bradymonadia bacterium]|jgi:protein PhnA